MTLKILKNIALVISSLIFLSSCNAMKSVSKSLGHHEVYTEIMIEAEPAEVWSVITDAENYKNWNPVIINAVGTYEVGSQITNTVVEAKDKQATIKSKVIKFDPPYHLNQFGGYTGIITFDHHYELQKVDGGTMVIQREEYTGFYMNFWDASWVEPAYKRVNEALRKEVLRRKSQ